MDALYLSLSVMTLVLGVLFFLSPGTVGRLSRWLDRPLSAGGSGAVLRRRGMRYMVGLLLLVVSFNMFRLAYTIPLIK